MTLQDTLGELKALREKISKGRVARGLPPTMENCVEEIREIRRERDAQLLRAAGWSEEDIRAVCEDPTDVAPQL